jgi:hypothetical protein
MANVPSGVGALSGYALPSGYSPAGGGRGPSPFASLNPNDGGGYIPRSGTAVGQPSYAPFNAGAMQNAGGIGVLNPLALADLLRLGPDLSAMPIASLAALGHPQRSPGMAAVAASGPAAISGVAGRPALPRSGGKGATL